MPRLFDLLQVGGGSNSERSQNLPALLDLFRSNATSANRHTAQLGNLYSAPAEPKWDIRSGKPEPGLGQVTPEEWLPPGVGMKLAALAKGLLGKAAIAGTFIGPRHSSWMKDAADEALRLKAQGVDPREIWARTRTFTEHPGVDAVQEISDRSAGWSKSTLSDLKNNFESYDLAERAFDHPRLFEGYPSLGQLTTSVRTGGRPHGEYDPSYRSIMATAETPAKARSVMAHELQHGVQHEEGWPTGGNSRSILSDPQTREHALSIAKTLEIAGHAPKDAYERASYEVYRRLAGEAQAEAARARANLTEAQLTQKYPGDSYPVPLKDLLIRR